MTSHILIRDTHGTTKFSAAKSKTELWSNYVITQNRGRRGQNKTRRTHHVACCLHAKYGMRHVDRDKLLCNDYSHTQEVGSFDTSDLGCAWQGTNLLLPAGFIYIRVCGAAVARRPKTEREQCKWRKFRPLKPVDFQEGIRAPVAFSTSHTMWKPIGFHSCGPTILLIVKK